MKFAPNSSFPGSGICNLAEEGRNFTSTFVRRLSRLLVLLLRGNRQRCTDLQAHASWRCSRAAPNISPPVSSQFSTELGWVWFGFFQKARNLAPSHRHFTRKILQETIPLFVLLAFPLSLVGLMRHACRTAMDDATRNEEREGERFFPRRNRL